MLTVGMTPTPESTPKDVALRSVQEVWNEYRYDAIDELHAADYVRHHDSDAQTGPDGYKADLANVLQVIPDSHCHVEQVIADGELVMLRLTQWGPIAVASATSSPRAGASPSRPSTSSGSSTGRSPRAGTPTTACPSSSRWAAAEAVTFAEDG